MAGGNVQSQSSVKYWIHSIIAICIMIFARFIPVPYPFTPEGMLVLGVLIGAIYGYVNGNLFWSSIFAILVLGTSEVTTVNGLFVSVFSNANFMFLVSFALLVGYLGSVGFSQVIALKLVQSKVTKGRPWVLTLFLMLAAFIPASVMSVSAVFLMTLPILYGICDEVGIKKTDKWAVLTAIGIAMSCTLALGFWPFQVVPIVLLGQLTSAGYQGGLQFAPYVLFMIVIVALALPAIVLVIRALKPDVSKLFNYNPPEEKVKFNSEQKFAGFLVILLLAFFIIPQFLPSGTAVQTFFGQFGAVAIVSTVLAIGVLIRKNGKPRVDIADAASKGLPMWPLIVMVGTVLTIAGLLTREDLGFVPFVMTYLGPILGVDNVVVFTLIVLFIALILTSLVQGSLVIAIMVPLVIPIAMEMGFTVWHVMAPFAFVVNIGILLPSSHPLGAILHGHESVGSKNMLKYVPVFTIVFFAIAAIVGIPLGFLIF